MEKPFYFLVLISGIITISCYPMSSEEENKGFMHYRHLPRSEIERRGPGNEVNTDGGEDIIDEILSSFDDWKNGEKSLVKREVDYAESEPYTFNSDYLYPNSYNFYYPPSPYFMPDLNEIADIFSQPVTVEEQPKISESPHPAPEVAKKSTIDKVKKEEAAPIIEKVENTTSVIPNNSSEEKPLSANKSDEAEYIGIDMKDLTEPFPINNPENIFKGMKEASLVRKGDGTSDVEENYKGSIDTNGDFFDLSMDRETFLKRALNEKKSVFEMNLSKYFVDFVCGDDC